MADSNKTIRSRRGGSIGGRLDRAVKAAWKCVLFMHAEKGVSEEAADKAAEELFLLSCEVADAIKTLQTLRKLDERAEEDTDVSRETPENAVKTSTSEGDVNETKVPF